MSKQKTPFPNELWESLLNIHPQHFKGANPDIEMLRDNYQRYIDSEESTAAKLLFQIAIDNWSDKQIREFIYLLMESQEASSMSLEILHNTLIKIYKMIFEAQA